MDDKNNGGPGEEPYSNSATNEDKDAKAENFIPTEEKQDAIQNNGGGGSINKYIIIAIVVIIILLIIAYIMYHFNILGVRALVRNTLGLNHKAAAAASANSSSSNISSANAALISAVSSYFPSLNPLNLTTAAIYANNLNSSGFLHYSVFGEGDMIKPFENGTFPINYSGLLVLFIKVKTNRTLGYVYKSFLTSTKEYNLSFGGIPAVVSMVNITQPANASLTSSEGALNISSYGCGSSGLRITLYNKMNQTVNVTEAEALNESNAHGDGSAFSSSGTAKPGKTLTLSFPKETCNSSSYEVILSGKTNYSISNMSTFISLIKFSNKLQTSIPNDIIDAMSISNSTLYEVSVLVGGNTYISQVNSSLNKLLESLSTSDFN